MAKKPWRPIQVSEDTGRFTRRQAEDAVRAVKERNQARNKNGRPPAPNAPANADRKAGASTAPKPRSVTAARARSKSEV
jgi:hypothetical protein